MVVPVRNERDRIAGLLADIEAQTRKPERVVFVDGSSEDGTREWLESAAADRPWLRIVDNPERIIPAALNAALTVVDTDVFARMDAHVDYPADYLEMVVGLLEREPGAAGAGGPYGVAGEGPWGQAIAAVLRQPWGHGAGRHQVGAEPGPVPHVRWCAYRTDALRAAGTWDPTMLVNEDEEMDIRVRRAYGPLWLVPAVRSTWYTRRTYRGLVQQMWRYGYFRAITVTRHPDSLQLRIMAPPGLVLALFASLAFRRRTGYKLTLSYLGVSGALGAYSASSDSASAWRGAAVLPAVHGVYGCGFWVGLAAGLTRRRR